MVIVVADEVGVQLFSVVTGCVEVGVQLFGVVTAGVAVVFFHVVVTASSIAVLTATCKKKKLVILRKLIGSYLSRAVTQPLMLMPVPMACLAYARREYGRIL